MNAQLIFPPTGQPQGFSTLAMAQWDGRPEPIVRELLQNALDAAREANRDSAEVWFTISECAIGDLPGNHAFRQAFEAAVEERSKGIQGAAERRVIERIESALGADSIPLLFCRDNGRGLNNDGLGRVLTEGNTDKETGGGTTGVGHLTAFAASDLRYVLYAGRSRGSQGELANVVSAHAILAAHRSQDDPEIGISGDGYLLRPGQQSLFSADSYPDEVPPLLVPQVEAIEDTGSVVCVAGFNSFRDRPNKVVESIRRVAATHFLAAIAENRMVVGVRDEAGSEGTVNRASLDPILAANKGQRTRHGGVLLPGEQAYRAWRVFSEGVRLTDCGVDGVTVWFRRLKDDEGGYSRIQLYRDGMWITNEAPHLLDRDFVHSLPFDGVVMVEPGPLYDLVRDAEGPEHLGLHRERLVADGDDQRWRQLREMLSAIGDRLRQEAGERERTTAYTPQDFATFTGSTLRAADVVPPYRPRQSTSLENGSTTVQSDPEGDAPDVPRDPDPEPRPRPRPRPKLRTVAPKPGRGVPLRSTVVPQRNQNGEFDTLHVRWRLTGQLPDMVGVRVRVPSGSDETCEQPLSPDWLRLRAIEHPGGRIEAKGGNATEIAVPPADGTLTITLADAITDPNAVEVDIVRRRQGDGDD